MYLKKRQKRYLNLMKKQYLPQKEVNVKNEKPRNKKVKKPAEVHEEDKSEKEMAVLEKEKPQPTEIKQKPK